MLVSPRFFLVSKLVGPWRKRGAPILTEKERIPTPNTLAYLITQPDALQSEKTATFLKQLATAHQNIDLCIQLASQFASMVRERVPDQLTPWLQVAEASDLNAFSHFAKSLRKDEAAFRAALQFEWSNGAVEGHVNRLKMIKRMMFGRANFDLLRHRVLYQF